MSRGGWLNYKSSRTGGRDDLPLQIGARTHVPIEKGLMNRYSLQLNLFKLTVTKGIWGNVLELY